MKKKKKNQQHWFECKVKYDRVGESGQQTTVSEEYVIRANSFSEAERRITEATASYVTGDFEVKKLGLSSYSEIIFGENNSQDKWYKCKVAFTTIDEKSEKEKRMTVTYLVQGNSLQGSLKGVEKFMGTSMNDYIITAVNETSILDVYN